MNTNHIYLYWVGYEYKLISILRNLIYLHSNSGENYTVHLITDKNINDYIADLPSWFSSLNPTHQADFVRVNIICDRGGIWLDSDTLVMDNLQSLFNILKTKDGFFILENNNVLCNGIFGSRARTPLMLEWKTSMLKILNIKKRNISWSEIGNTLLAEIKKRNRMLYNNYQVFNGLDNMYPVNWNNCITEFIDKPYDNYKTIVRKYQPLVVLVNSVYKKIDIKSEEEILQGNIPLNYFIKKSFENVGIQDLDFIEIGTSNFDTLLEKSLSDEKGISIEPIKSYLDDLPNKTQIKKINCALTHNKNNEFIDIYYIPNEEILKNKLPDWFRGCNTISKYHPLHIKHNVTHLVKTDRVKLLNIDEFLQLEKVRRIKFLKIDTEGHDVVILKGLYEYLKTKEKIYFPLKIKFESNENTPPNDVTHIINLFISLGYVLVSRGYDTIIKFIQTPFEEQYA